MWNTAGTLLNRSIDRVDRLLRNWPAVGKVFGQDAKRPAQCERLSVDALCGFASTPRLRRALGLLSIDHLGLREPFDHVREVG